jgi:hypothetical protein
VSGLQLVNQELDVGGDKFLLAAGLLLSMVATLLVVAMLRMVFAPWPFGICFCTSALKRGMYMPNASWRKRG